MRVRDVRFFSNLGNVVVSFRHGVGLYRWSWEDAFNDAAGIKELFVLRERRNEDVFRVLCGRFVGLFFKYAVGLWIISYYLLDLGRQGVSGRACRVRVVRDAGRVYFSLVLDGLVQACVSDVVCIVRGPIHAASTYPETPPWFFYAEIVANDCGVNGLDDFRPVTSHFVTCAALSNRGVRYPRARVMRVQALRALMRKISSAFCFFYHAFLRRVVNGGLIAKWCFRLVRAALAAR